MTYRDLLNELLQFTSNELEQHVSVHTVGLDEFFPVSAIRVAGADGESCPAAGILDNGSCFLEIDG